MLFHQFETAFFVLSRFLNLWLNFIQPILTRHTYHSAFSSVYFSKLTDPEAKLVYQFSETVHHFPFLVYHFSLVVYHFLKRVYHFSKLIDPEAKMVYQFSKMVYHFPFMVRCFSRKMAQKRYLFNKFSCFFEC